MEAEENNRGLHYTREHRMLETKANWEVVKRFFLHDNKTDHTKTNAP